MTLREGLVQVELFIPDNPGSATFKKILPLNMTVHKLSGLVQRILKTGSHMPRFYLIHKQVTYLLLFLFWPVLCWLQTGLN